MYDAIVLAGGENSGQLSRFSEQPYEAMIEIAGKPMVTFVAEALANTSQVERIFVLGPAILLQECSFPDKVVILEGGSTILETIQFGMAALGHKRKALVVTADIPLLTSAAIEDFLRQSMAEEADLYYPIVSKALNDRNYPGHKRTYVRFREGIYTGGNIFLVDPLIVPKCLDVAGQLIENRKRPFKLCRMLGWGFILQFIMGTLSIGKVKRRVAELLGIKGAVIHSGYPELGIDVDKASDLELVRSVFSFKTI
jgi:GTP:adenosylcobinamide-phosphate guanylyltransferase